MLNRYLEEKTEMLKSCLQKSNSNDKVTINQKMISVMQADIKRAELMIESLQNDKETLKIALSAAVNKRDKLYKIVLEYKQALEKSNKKALEVEYHLDEVNIIKNEIEKVKKQLIRRDEKIRTLHNRNIELEQLLDEQDITSKVLKKMYKNTKPDESKIGSNLFV